jgi:hypothetical protein
VFFQRNEQLVIISAFGVSVFLRLCCDFRGRCWGFGDCWWCWWDFDSFSPSHKECPQQDLSFSNGWNGCPAVDPFLHVLVLDSPEAFLGDGFTTYGGCGPCFSLSHSDLVHPHCDFSLLGPTDFFPQVPGLVIKELIQGDNVGDYVVQQVFLVVASF